MCERICPACASKEHVDHYGMGGSSLICEGCGITLAIRADEAFAPIDLNDDEAEAWALARRGVLPGAEALNPADDEIWRGPALQPSGGDNNG